MDFAGAPRTRAAAARAVCRVLCLSGVLALAASVTPAFAAPTLRVSVSTGGGQADAASASPAVSTGGAVAFASLASNLIPGDDNEASDIFVFDSQTGQTERVSVASNGGEANGDSILPAISADGRFVAFVSAATNLVTGDGNGVADVFLHDRQTGSTIRVSVATDGTQANGPSTTPAISANGRYVAFVSAASNLVSGDTNGKDDVFVHDRLNGHTERVNVTTQGAQSAGDIGGVAISGDGRYVAFASTAPDLVAGDANGVSDVFVYDRQAAVLTLVSASGTGVQGNGASAAPAISGDGRFVAFVSEAANLVAGDTNGVADVFVRDNSDGAVERVSVTSDGSQVSVPSGAPSLSPDGRYLSFSSAAPDLVPGDTGGWVDVFVHDRQTGRTERVSITPTGAGGDADSGRSAISLDGRCVAFESLATNLVAGDTNLVQDVFLCERPVANFTADVTNGLLPLVVTFTDLSTGNPTSWDWDFGDWATDTVQNPVHTYEEEGLYTVTLTVASVYGSDTIVKAAYIRAIAPVPHAIFSGAPTSGPAPLVVTFTNQSTNSPTSYYWVFGDGDTSVEKNPVHTYTHDGSFTVSLIANNDWGSDIATRQDYITVWLLPPIADFVATPTGAAVPMDVAFTDRSVNAPTSWDWVFGDGGTSTEQNPTHTYTTPGVYTVALTVRNRVGSDTEAKPDYIVAAAPPPLIANFSAAPTVGFAPLIVTFTDASTNTPVAWAWSFGDGAIATVQNPTHTYQKVGTYTVSLTATNVKGSDAETKAHYILVTFPDVPFAPQEYWALHQILACVDANIVAGYPDGTYKPTTPVTRDQMAVYISRALVTPTGDAAIPDPTTPPSFSDVPATYWAFKYIEFAKARNIVTGYPDGSYAPGNPVDRGQMAVYISRAIATPTAGADLALYTPPAAPSFPDVPTTFWAYKYIEYAKFRGVVAGYPDGSYQPAVVVTRDQMAVYVARAFKLE